jgi:hypothetical protein
MSKILFVNQEKSQCGVYQFGKNTSLILLKYNDIHKFEYLETTSPIDKFDYDLIVFNYHPCTMSWINNSFLTNVRKSALLMHDERPNFNNISVFRPDPTFGNTNTDFNVGRPILHFDLPNQVLPDTIGSFGFGFDHKGFEDLVQKVNDEFEQATVRIHIPLNTKVDSSGYYALRMSKKLKSIPLKPNIKLVVTHDYKDEQQLVNWLSENSINVFMYKNTNSLSQGCSSSVDWALASKRPIAVTNDPMFRHITTFAPETCLEKRSLKSILENPPSLDYFYENWSERKFYENYCEVINEVLRS